MNNKLFDLISKIFYKENGFFLKNGSQELLANILINNGLERDECIPERLIFMFNSILSQQSVPITDFKHKAPNTGDVFNFIAELEDVMGVEWKDTGEDVEIFFKNSNVIANISLESDTFYVECYNNMKDKLIP